MTPICISERAQLIDMVNINPDTSKTHLNELRSETESEVIIITCNQRGSKSNVVPVSI